jgi:predicted AAA+ superfamily ATPase
MISKLSLSEIIEDQKESFLKKRTVEREIDVPMAPVRIMIISGVRRCGKSTLIRQKFLKNKTALYINFEDPRLVNFSLDDFPRLEEIAAENGKNHLLLDEVQNINKWELFARMANEKGIYLYITGSNASMLSRELGTHLTGRYNQLELFPFSFAEFLRFFKLKRNRINFDQYFELGGFPEFLNEKDENYLRTLLRDIIVRDIAVRRNIVNENQLMRLAVHLLSNIGKEFSYNNIAKILEFKSVRTVIDYCYFLNESYLMEFIPMYSTSVKKQMVNPKKVYSIDPVLSKANSLSFSKDLGRRLENFVYLGLRRRFKEIFYYRNFNAECDFLVKEKEQVVLAVQSCWEINNETQERELRGIQNAIKDSGATKSAIITYNQEDSLDGIDLIPVWKWI